MFSNVLVGVDERPGGRDAIALAKHLVAAGGLITLAYIDQGDPRARIVNPAYAAGERERLRDLLETARRGADIDAALVWTGERSVGRGLHKLARRFRADLLVVGSTSRSLIGRVLIGDDTRRALTDAPCMVAVAPRGYSGRCVVMGEIGVAYDGSLESERAVAVARELASDLGATVSAFEAVSVAFDTEDDGEAPDHLVEEARQRIEALGDVEPHAAYGNPADELALYGASVDLLIVGARGLRGVGRLIHASTSQRLARVARCPLLVLPGTTDRRKALDGSRSDREAVAAASR